MNEQVGPIAPSGTGSLLKVFGSLIGGIIGTGVLMLIASATSSFFQPVLDQSSGDEIAPIVVFIFMGMLFLSTLSANVCSVVLMALSERDKYKRLSRTIFQTFLVNLVIFIGLAPLYLLMSTKDLSVFAGLASIQIIMSIIASSMILEIISNEQYGIVGVYAAVFGTIIGIGLNFMIYTATNDTSLLMFTVFPLLWMSIAVANVVSNLFYYQIYKVAGVDFLNTNEGKEEDLQEENEEEAPATEEEVLEAKSDDTGSDFLKQ